MSVEKLERKFCTGCMACKNICPVDAIAFEYNEKGFLYPKIDKEKCIECGVCEKTCPMLNKEKKEEPTQEIYAAKNKNMDIRLGSSSGGLFHELTDIVLNRNGYVCGAIFDDSFNVIHEITNSHETRNKMQTAKYVQSRINDIYKKVEEMIKENKEVLFSGTPCQVDGLYKYLSTKNIITDKLITCDIVCHGCPSPKVFEEYLKDIEEKYKSKIKSINFRHKENDYTQNIKIEFENGQTYINSTSGGDYYYRLFSYDYMLRESCYNCNYTNMNRVGDITIGDFWGIEKVDDSFSDNKGVSLVIINSNKGKELFNEVKDKFEVLFVEDKEKCLQHNLKNPTAIPNNYDSIWKAYYEKGFEGFKQFLDNN